MILNSDRYCPCLYREGKCKCGVEICSCNENIKVSIEISCPNQYRNCDNDVTIIDVSKKTHCPCEDKSCYCGNNQYFILNNGICPY